MKSISLVFVMATAMCGSLSAQVDFLIPEWFEDESIEQEFSNWDVFYGAPNQTRFPRTSFNVPIYPDLAAPVEDANLLDAQTGVIYANEAVAPDIYLHYADPSNPTVTQVGNPNIWVTSSDNLYLPGLPPIELEIEDSTGFPIGSVLIQFFTSGQFFDFDTVTIEFDDPNTGQPVSLAPTDREALFLSGAGGEFGGSTILFAYQWDLTSYYNSVTATGVTDYSINWNAGRSSVSVQEILLDTVEPFPTGDAYRPQIDGDNFLTWLVLNHTFDQAFPTSNPDFDPLDAQREYGVDERPSVYDATAVRRGIAPFAGNGNKDTLYLEITRPAAGIRNPDLPESAYIFRYSTDPTTEKSTWAILNKVVTDNGDGTENVRAYAPAPVASGEGQGFMVFDVEPTGVVEPGS